MIYARTKKIGSTVFNYKDVVDNVIASDWKYDTSNACSCSKSEFCDPHHGHIVTGDLIIENSRSFVERANISGKSQYTLAQVS